MKRDSDIESKTVGEERANPNEGILPFMGVIMLAVAVAVCGLLAFESYRRTTESDDAATREYRCAEACIPDRVESCPPEGAPVCKTNGLWSVSYIAGQRPEVECDGGLKP